MRHHKRNQGKAPNHTNSNKRQTDSKVKKEIDPKVKNEIGTKMKKDAPEIKVENKNETKNENKENVAKPKVNIWNKQTQNKK